MIKKTDEYAVMVADAIMGLFRDEEDGGNVLHHIDIEKVNGTEFITGMIKGCNVVFQQLTQDQKNNLEFTYLCNQLIVQDLIDRNKKK